MKFLWTILTFTLTFWSAPAQNVNLNVSTNQLANPDFSSASTASMYSIIQGNFVESLGQYDSIYFGDGIIDAMADLDMTNIRFPGGTISQYYHFNGSGGYGIDFGELTCRPNFLPLNGYAQRVITDSIYPENLIGKYAEMIALLEQKQGHSIGVLYVVNILTHFLNGDFIPYNPIIDSLIFAHAGSLQNQLDNELSLLDSASLEKSIEVMFDVVSDPIIGAILNHLSNQPGFEARFTENLEAIQFLIDNDLNIKGIELGNESYAPLMLKDDDLSEIPYDCTTPDSIVEQIGNIALPLKAYMQAIVKYAMITASYSEVIKNLWDIETGVVLAPHSYSVNTVSLTEFEIKTFSNDNSKYHELWNKFIEQLNFYDALIPHLYLKPLPECDIFEEVSVDDLSTFIKNRINFYFDEVIPFQLEKFKSQVGEQTLWATEWNINKARIFSNTFAHANHTFRFLNELNLWQNNYNISQSNYHQMVSWNFNQFALIRPEYDAQGNYNPNLQSMYHAFDFMADVNNNQLKLTSADISNWLVEANSNSPDYHFWTYINNDYSTLTFNFLNQSDEAIDLPLTSINFNIYEGSNLITSKHGGSYKANYLDAESMFSSNRGCDDYPENYDSYNVIEVNENDAAFTIPSFSYGSISINLEEVTSNQAQLSKIKPEIYPNPANNQLNIKVDDATTISSFHMIDALGRIVMTDKFDNELNSIAINHLPNGIYNIRLIDKYNKIVGSEMVVVER